MILFSLPVLSPISTLASTDQNPHINKSVEFFELETFDSVPNELGLYEEDGYQQTLNVFESRDLPNRYHYTTASVTDYYDLENNFLYSEIEYLDYNNNFQNGKAEQIYDVVHMDEPLVSENITQESENKLENYVNRLVRKELDLKSSEEVQGVSQEDLDLIHESVEESKEFTPLSQDELNSMASDIDPNFSEVKTNSLNTFDFSIASTLVDSGGAFDNYFNEYHNGDFLIQALAPESDENRGVYFRVEGNTNTSVNDHSKFTDFRNSIMRYDEIMELQLLIDTSPDALNWYSTLASFVVFTFGWGVGPVGWANNALQASNALIIFADLTSQAYATDVKLTHSEAAMRHLNNAREIVWAPGLFDDYDFNLVNGYSG